MKIPTTATAVTTTTIMIMLTKTIYKKDHKWSNNEKITRKMTKRKSNRQRI